MHRRVMIAGTGSGCGKTTITCAILSALKMSGRAVISFKCGPDYIDPMFHKKAAGVEARNLDVFLMGEDSVRYALSYHSAKVDIAVLEGVMGLYDGVGAGSYASANHISVLTGTPVVLVVNVRGKALSVCAEVKGYLELEKNNIKAVILNNVSDAMYPFYKEMIEQRLAVKVLGHMPSIAEAYIESRHLGLITADEICDIQAKIKILGENALRTIDINGLIEISDAGELISGKTDFTWKTGADSKEDKVIIYAARDKAFAFYYEDNLDLLRALGAQIKFFSPLNDMELPDDASGLLLWGGYPELYASELENAVSMNESIKRHIVRGIPTYAECGGFMYLQETLTDISGRTYNMLGALPGHVKMTKRLRHFGYHELVAQKDNLLCKKSESINTHFFHYSQSDSEGDSFMAIKKSRGTSLPCVVADKNIFAGYQHLHFWGNINFAENFVEACRRYRNEVEYEICNKPTGNRE